MEPSVWNLWLLTIASYLTLSFGLPSSTAAMQGNMMRPSEKRHFFHSSFTRPSAVGPIKRGGPPFVLIQPMTMRPTTSRRLVLTLPKDNIHILNAEAMPEKGQPFLPTTLTLSLKDVDSDDSSKSNRYLTTRDYASQIPSPPRQASRYNYGVVPFPQGDSDEDYPKPRRWNKVSFEMDDLMGSPGGHVTVIKAHTARKVMSGGSSYKPMKAILIKPKEIEAKRVEVMDAAKVMATKARILASSDAPLQGYKVKAHPVSYQKVSKTKGEDWAASNLHLVKTEAPRHQEENAPSLELQCGGSNDLGWCDLGINYPSAEVSQIMEVCEELVQHMFVEIPEEPMEDIASYSLSRNITPQASKPFHHWKATQPLCEVSREVIRPSFAQDMKGKWHVIIQTDAFPQRIALEVCKKPGEPCSSNDLCSKSKSQCIQKYSHHQLISFDPESAETCPYVRLYKFPTTCVCRLSP